MSWFSNDGNNKNDNNSTDEQDGVEFFDLPTYLDHPANMLTAVTCALFGAVGLLANAFLLCFLLHGMKDRKPHELVMMGLALTDTLFCLSNVVETYSILYAARTTFCKVNGFFHYVFATSSLNLPCLGMINRYLSLYKPELLKRLFTRKFVIGVYIANFGFYVVRYLPFIILNGLGLDDLGVCGLQLRSTFLKIWDQSDELSAIVAYTVSAVCAAKILKKIRQHKFGVAANFQSHLIEESKQITQLMIMLLCIPLVCQAPTVVIKALQCFIVLNPWISRTITSSFSITSVISPFLIMFKIKTYRRDIKKLVLFLFANKNLLGSSGDVNVNNILVVNRATSTNNNKWAANTVGSGSVNNRVTKKFGGNGKVGPSPMS